MQIAIMCELIIDERPHYSRNPTSMQRRLLRPHGALGKQRMRDAIGGCVLIFSFTTLVNAPVIEYNPIASVTESGRGAAR